MMNSVFMAEMLSCCRRLVTWGPVFIVATKGIVLLFNLLLYVLRLLSSHQLPSSGYPWWPGWWRSLMTCQETWQVTKLTKSHCKVHPSSYIGVFPLTHNKQQFILVCESLAGCRLTVARQVLGNASSTHVTGSQDSFIKESLIRVGFDIQANWKFLAVQRYQEFCLLTTISSEWIVKRRSMNCFQTMFMNVF